MERLSVGLVFCIFGTTSIRTGKAQKKIAKAIVILFYERLNNNANPFEGWIQRQKSPGHRVLGSKCIINQNILDPFILSDGVRNS